MSVDLFTDHRTAGPLSSAVRVSPEIAVAQRVLPGIARATPACTGCASRSASPRISVVVPTYNEARNIGWVLNRMPAQLHEVIIVDGRSSDDTVEVARAAYPHVRVLAQAARGKGVALATGLAAATGDIIVMMDADGSMDPVEIPSLVGSLIAGADVVKGSRAASGGGSTDLSPLRALGNWLLTATSNRIYRQRWRELCYGYAAFWADVVDTLEVPAIVARAEAERVAGVDSSQLRYGHGFEIEALLFCRSARAGLRIAEVFSFEHERRHGESNLSTFRDGVRVLGAVWHERRFAPAVPVRVNARRYPMLPALHENHAAA